MVSIDASAVQWSLPEGERAGKPLVLLLHGVGSFEGDLIGLAPHLAPEFVYASLRAPLPFDNRPGGGAYSWYPLSTPGAPEYGPVDEAADAVLDYIDSLTSEGAPAHPTVGVLGFSQGGSMALQLLRKRPTFFDFAVVLAGFVAPGAPDAVEDGVRAADPRVFYGRGDADPIIPPAAVERTEAWLAEYAPTATLSVYPGLAHGISQEELGDVNAFLSEVHPA